MIFDWLLRRRYDMPHFLCYRPTVAVFLSDSSDAHPPESALITALVQMVSRHMFKINKTNHGIKSNKKKDLCFNATFTVSLEFPCLTDVDSQAPVLQDH